MKQKTDSKYMKTCTNTVYRLGAAAALMAALIRRNFDAEYAMLQEFGILNTVVQQNPDTMEDWFMLLQDHPLAGFTLLNGFDLFNYIFAGVLILVLWIDLKRINSSWAASAGFLGISGAILYAATNKAFTLLAASSQFEVSNHAEYMMLLDKGGRLLAVHESNNYAGPGLYPSFFMITTALLIMSVMMLQSQDFHRHTALIGILANSFGLGYYPVLLLIPGMVFVPLSISAVFLLAFYILVAIRFRRLSKQRKAK